MTLSRRLAAIVALALASGNAGCGGAAPAVPRTVSAGGAAASREVSTALDDSIDQIHRTAKKIALFDMRAFEPAMAQMGGVIVEAAELAGRMVSMLPDMREKNARIAALTVEMTRLEERADELHDHGVKALYQAHRTSDAMAFVVGAEIYDHLEKVMDRLEDIANQISGIVIEHI